MSVTAQLMREAGLSAEEAEYIGGRLYVNAFPTGRHQRVVFRLQRQLDDQLPSGYEINRTIGWKPMGDEFGPDLIVYPAADYDETAPRFTGMPLLVVEVLAS